jgi:hypothetical protein
LQSIAVAIRPAILNRDVPALEMAGFAQAFAECRNELCGACGRADIEIANHWHPSLLRARYERPSGGRAAKRDNEFSPSDADCHVTLPPGGRVH